MKAHKLAALRHELPSSMAYLYYPDRESPWLLARRMGERARVADLKAGPTARYLDRPLVKPVVAASGGVVARADVIAAAMADHAIDGPLSRPAAAGVAAAFERPWYTFKVTFGAWGTEAFGFALSQMSRPGKNLVLQLGFPQEDVDLLTEYLGAGARTLFEVPDHPVRSDGPPTLAWARLDIEGKVALIEELQSDWLRAAEAVSKYWAHQRPQRQITYAMQAYEAEVRARYGTLWPKALLLATLGFLRDVAGVREVYLHQHAPGLKLKGIDGRAPPVSLYGKLPKSFGFEETAEAPHFLARRHRRHLAPFRRAGKPVFWRLAL